MITKVLVAVGIAAFATAGTAVPASADPASYADIGCECQAPVQQGPTLQGPFLTDPFEQGFRQGFLETDSDPAPR